MYVKQIFLFFFSNDIDKVFTGLFDQKVAEKAEIIGNLINQTPAMGAGTYVEFLKSKRLNLIMEPYDSVISPNSRTITVKLTSLNNKVVTSNVYLRHNLYVNSSDNSTFTTFEIVSDEEDNPFLNEEYVKSLEELYIRNPAKARIYCDGEWGNDPEGMVFKNWKVEDFDYLELSASGLEHRVGSDFGFVDPSTIVASLWDKDNKIIYVYDEFYKKGCQLDDMYKAMIDMGLRKSKIYMDSAEPRSIDYFRRQGINAVPCIKGRDSVEARIAFLQNHLIIISPKCKNVINEFENFCFLKDKKTGSYSDKMDHTYSHTIDGLGYSYSDIYTKQRLRTLDKSILGL